MGIEEDKILFDKQNLISKDKMMLDEFCIDYDFIRATQDRQGKRINYLSSKGYSDIEIWKGKEEYNKRKEDERKENKNKKEEYIIDVFEISIWNGDKEKVTFDDIIGLDDAKKILLDRFDKYYMYINGMKQHKIEPASGIGLHGVSGVGKSELMKALLNKMINEFPEPKPILLYISISDLLTSKRGEVAKIIKKFFDRIKTIDNLIIICIDEIDMVMRGKNDTSSVLTRELTSIFLQQWNGSGNIFVVFTTNLLNDVADAFVSRIGYENCVYCKIPSSEERFLLFKKYLTFLTNEQNNLLSSITPGYVGRDIKKTASHMFVLKEENNPLLDKHIIEKIDELNILRNKTINSMLETNKYKNLPSKYTRPIDVPEDDIKNKIKYSKETFEDIRRYIG